MMKNGMIFGRGSVDSSKQALVMDLKDAVGDADRLLTNVVDASADEIALARRKLESRLADARSVLMDASRVVSDRAKYAADATDAYVRDNPWKMLGVAAAAGIVIGGILLRRH
jgi:ElaB/YqjD/DUF883 family membrane-anchored ribosome-binding protein